MVATADDRAFILRTFRVSGAAPAVLDQAADMVAAMRAVEPNVSDAIMMARAAELAMRPGPRRPLAVELDELRERDLKLLRGDQ